MDFWFRNENVINSLITNAVSIFSNIPGVRLAFGQFTNEFTFEGTGAEHTEALTEVELTTAPTDLSSTIEQQQQQEQQTMDDVTVVQSSTVSVVSKGNNLEMSSTSRGLNSTTDDVTKEVTSSTVKISSDNATSPLLGNDTTVGDSTSTDKEDNRKPVAEISIKSQYPETETKTIIIVVVTVVGGLLVIAVVVGIIIKNRPRIMRLIRRKDEEVFVLNDRQTSSTQGTDGRHGTEGHAPRTSPSPSGQVVAETGYQPYLPKGNVTGGGSSRLQERPVPHANTGYKDNESQRL